MKKDILLSLKLYLKCFYKIFRFHPYLIFRRKTKIQKILLFLHTESLYIKCFTIK